MKFVKGMREMKDEFAEALKKDLGRDNFLADLTEITPLLIGAEHDYKHLKKWSSDITENTELALAPGKTYIKYEPLGVVAIYGSWNYPIQVTLKPLVSAISAGNCAIIKPSEVSANSSAAIKKFVDTYLDPEAFACIEGEV